MTEQIENKYGMWFVAHHEKKDKWVAIPDGGDYTCATHPITKQGFTIYGCLSMKRPEDAIAYIKGVLCR